MELAGHIDAMKFIIYQIDMEHLRSAIEVFKNQASFQDSAAVLHPSYNPVKTQLLRQQTKALQHLADYIDALKECDELKKKASETDAQRDNIHKLFV